MAVLEASGGACVIKEKLPAADSPQNREATRDKEAVR